jgi:hypothetical protein
MRQRILAGIILSLTAATSNAAPISGQGTWETTLQGRLPLTPGGTDYRAYYDTELDITWLADPSYAVTSGYDTNLSNHGGMLWSEQQAFIVWLNTGNHLGVNDWRLSIVTDTGTAGCNFGYTGTDCGYNVDVSTGEMAHMFYSTLGNKGAYDTSGTLISCSGNVYYYPCLTNQGPFSRLAAGTYWSGTLYAPRPSRAWLFDFHLGGQGFEPTDVEYTDYGGWPVRPGDIGLVPLPAVGWLLVPAFGAFGWLRRRRVPRHRRGPDPPPPSGCSARRSGCSPGLNAAESA